MDPQSSRLDAHHPDTKERLLRTAERMFAAKGLYGTTLRDITREAEANLAAVNYHFGSKDHLALEVFRRRIRPINRERLRLLDEAEAAHGDAPVPTEELVHHLLSPALLLFDPEDPVLPGLLGRFTNESHPELLTMMREELSEVLQRYVKAFHRSLPELPMVELRLRIHFQVGSMIHTIAHLSHLDFSALNGEPRPHRDVVLSNLVHYTVSALRAPSLESLQETGATEASREREAGA